MARLYAPLKPLLLALLVAVPAAASLGAMEKVDLALSRLQADDGPEAAVPVIIQTAQEPTTANLHALQALGGMYRRSFKAITGFAATVPSDRLNDLASLPWVKCVSADAPVHQCLDVTAPAVGADFAWNTLGLTGRGVTVAVIDSGVAEHADFSRILPHGTIVSRIIGGRSWVEAARRYSGNDKCGHGTNVAGIIAGNGLSSSNVGDEERFYRHFVGIAPEASIVNCRVLGWDGDGAVSDVISAVEWCVGHSQQLNIRVINLSLGHPVGESYTTDPLCQACEYAWSNGIVVVVSAGNLGWGGYSTILSPGNDPYVITVGAVNTRGTAARGDDVMCSYSSRGPTGLDHILKPDLVAPGNRMISTRHRNSYLERYFQWSNLVPVDYYYVDPRRHSKSEYFVLSGTSMAAATVSGAAALVLQQCPGLTPDTVKTRLMLTAEKSEEYGPLVTGAGYLSLPAALQSTVLAATPARSPTVVEDGEGGVTFQCPQVQGENIIWDPLEPGVLAPVYPNQRLGANYTPDSDPLWDGYDLLSYSAACADISCIAIIGD